VLEAFAQKTRADAPKPPDDGKPDDGKPDDKPDDGKPDDKPEKPKPDCWKQHFAVREVNKQIFEVRREESSLRMRIDELDDRILALKKGDPLPEDDTGDRGPNMPHIPGLRSGKKKSGRKDIAIDVGQAIIPFIIDNAREGFEDLAEPFYEFNSDKVRELEAEKATLNEKLDENLEKQRALEARFEDKKRALEKCQRGES